MENTACKKTLQRMQEMSFRGMQKVGQEHQLALVVRKKRAGVGRSLRMVFMIGKQRGMPTWSANSAKMANMLVKLLSNGKYVGGILRMEIGCVATVRMVNM